MRGVAEQLLGQRVVRRVSPAEVSVIPPELGTLPYVNLSPTQAVLDLTLQDIVRLAKKKNKLILANFAEWPGCEGPETRCKRAGRIFFDEEVNEMSRDFVCVAFNTWSRVAEPHRVWGGKLSGSSAGYLRVVSPFDADPRGKVVAETGELTSRDGLQEVKKALADGIRIGGEHHPNDCCDQLCINCN